VIGGDEGVPKVWIGANVVVRVVGQSFCCRCFSSVVAVVVRVALLPGSRGGWLRRTHLCASLSGHRRYPTDPTRLASVGDIKYSSYHFLKEGCKAVQVAGVPWRWIAPGGRGEVGARVEPPCQGF
jgi:hypothetical protein